MLSLDADAIPVFERDFDRFLDFLNGDTKRPLISPKSFALVFNFDMQSLATAAHVHRNTVTRAPESESVQRYLRESIRIVRAAADAAHSIEKAIFWYKNHPIPTFDYKTAQQLVSEGRSDDLIRYLQSLRAGFSG
jgi:hypothetical protein